MEKVNCGFCGTAYPDTEEKCPICGFPRTIVRKTEDQDVLLEEDFDFLNERDVPRKNKPIFDYDEVNADDHDADDEEDDEEYDDDDEEDEEEPKSNALLIVILVILITLLLLATGFVFFRYFLPNITGGEETTVATTVATLPTEAEETTEATIPCRMLALTSDAAMLNKEGQPWLLHVTVTPEDTTDELTYTSGDETVATVSEDGKIIAVGEGETYILIACGEQTIKCPVIVDYDMAIEQTQEENVPTLGVEETEASSEPVEETKADEVSEEADVTTATEADETAAEETQPGEIVLKLKKTDISLGAIRGISYELELDCDLDPSEVEWVTMNANVVLVKDGVITVMGSGTTKVVAKYNGQTAECIVRCVF